MDIQHQYWVTKQTVLRKLGGKEDECIVASDAELDAKLELFRSISESCSCLQKVIDQYQERLCILAQEENALGHFLKEGSKLHENVGKHMSSSGKGLCYLGQQRMLLRDPLIRLHHEVDTFKARAVQDTRLTLGAMERARTEYRADLKWMKAVSAQLDPDTGRGLEKFRKAQNQTRLSKQRFDRLTLDCLEKVDLLAAARCNMFSHALVPYQAALLQFFTRCSQTLHSTLNSLNAQPKYDFCILKELKEEQNDEDVVEEKGDDKFADDDQLLFFQDEYTDEEKPQTEDTKSEDLLGITSDITVNINYDLLGLMDDNRQQTNNTTNFFEDLLDYNDSNNSASGQDLNDDILSDILANSSNTEPVKEEQSKKNTMTNWLKLFSDLDPLANPDTMMGQSSNSHRT